jgi:hypothetical protein
MNNKKKYKMKGHIIHVIHCLLLVILLSLIKTSSFYYLANILIKKQNKNHCISQIIIINK